ncbi:hypothetical protein GGI04_005307, partial [Coemansia thaxteri]
AELEQWHQAVELFDEQNYSAALEVFRSIADSAKIHFNIGLILGRRGDHDGAISAYDSALRLDQYLVVAYFQRGVAKMVQQRNEAALEDFGSALQYLRENEFIDYTQLGLEYKVYRCEVLYNRALCRFCMRQEDEAQADLAEAARHRAEGRHDLIQRAAGSRGMDCPLFCVPKGVVYRPSASKLKSTRKIDFLGSARVIASADGRDNFTGFKGALVRKETLRSAGVTSPVPIAHQKSMRVRRATPPPEASSALARSNTLPAHRMELAAPQQPLSAAMPVSRAPPSSLQRDAAAAASRVPGSLPAPSGMRAQIAAGRFGAPPDTPSVDVHASEDEDEGEDEGDYEESPGFSSSSAFTSPATAESDVTTPSPAARKGPVDPLDIIRAGLARRTTLKNQGAQQKGHQAHVARAEVIAPLIQRSNTEGGVQTVAAPGFHGGARQQQHAQHPAMMTPPLSHEEAIARGLAAMRVQNAHVQPALHHHHHQIHYDSQESAATSPSPSQASAAAAAHYAHASSLHPPLSAGSAVLRRAPTKKDAMKVKVHYGDDIVNLMVPKSASYESLRAKLAAKLAAAHSVPASAAGLRIRYLDEDGEAVLMTDEDDFELAKAYAGGDMSTPETNVVERLELWCSV